MSHPAPNSSVTRLAFLDVAKGFLVLLMVVYHALNYTNEYQLAFRYLSFLPPSFILITGFLLSIVYLPRLKAGDQKVSPRLFSRGIKLVLLFVALNIAAQYTRSPVYGRAIGIMGFWEQWYEIFIEGAGRTAAFEVLLPIAYILIASPPILVCATRIRTFIPTLATIFAACCTYLDVVGKSNSNLTLFSVGLIGMAIGNILSKPELLGRPLVASTIAYLIYFFVSLRSGHIYLIQAAGSIIALTLICSLSTRIGQTSQLHRFLLRLGQYSLLAYIVQIAALQTLSRILGRPDPISIGSLILLAGTMLVMLAVNELVDSARRFKRLDGLYRFIFS